MGMTNAVMLGLFLKVINDNGVYFIPDSLIGHYQKRRALLREEDHKDQIQKAITKKQTNFISESKDFGELQERASQSLIQKSHIEQYNVENIIFTSFDSLNENAKPQNMDRDWLLKFFDEARLISDEKMQELWARILAGEANQTGSFSKKTINIVSEISKKEAELFIKLCSFCWTLEDGTIRPILFIGPIPTKYNNTKLGLDFDKLVTLEEAGLIKIERHSTEFINLPASQQITSYFNDAILFENIGNDKNQSISIGSIGFTRAGEELSKICINERSKEYEDYLEETLLQIEERNKRYTDIKITITKHSNIVPTTSQ